MDRYARQTILPEIGQEGQKKLEKASVLCIGMGGLGSPSALYLAAAGIGHIGLVDDDLVDISNLQRQVLFKEDNQGTPKVKAAAQALKQLNSSCHIEEYYERFSAENAAKLISQYDVILDGTDNFSSKFLINDACVKYHKPLVYASILGFHAQVSVFYPPHSPCYRCLYPAPPSGYVPNCAEAGIIGAMAGIAGTVQALQALKMALGLEWCKEKQLSPLLGKLWILDAKTMQTRLLTVHKRLLCKLCSIKNEDITLSDDQTVCASDKKVKAITPEMAKEFIGKAVFIDVREPHELATGKIDGAMHIPIGTLLADEDSVGNIQSHTRVIVYCQHGVRSLSAAAQLVEMGFTNVFHLKGGMARWDGASE